MAARRATAAMQLRLRTSCKRPCLKIGRTHYETKSCMFMSDGKGATYGYGCI